MSDPNNIQNAQNQMMELMKTKLLLSNSDSNDSKKNLILLYLLPFLTKFFEEFVNCGRKKFECILQRLMNVLFSFKVLSDVPDYYYYKIPHTVLYNNELSSHVFDFISRKMKKEQKQPETLILRLSTYDSNCKILESIADGKFSYNKWISFYYAPNKLIEVKLTYEEDGLKKFNNDGKEMPPDRYRILIIRSAKKEYLGEFMELIRQDIVNERKKDEMKNKSPDKKLYFFFMKERLPKYIRSKEKSKNEIHFFRFLLSNEKSFDSLFIPQKEQLIRQLDDFSNKTGIYAKKGVPNKIGYLLHGPPGSGKTSFIKSLAAYMKRDIVSISLSQIDTNEELQHILHRARKKYIDSSDELHSYNAYYEDTIFIFEDIDCMGDKDNNILLDRNNKNKKEEAEKHYHKYVKDLKKKKKKQQKKKKKKTTTNSDTSDSDSDTSDSDSESEIEEYEPHYSYGGSWMKYFNKKTLDLSGILNILDGIIDTPERMIIMTTNHVNKLDPALIRPGRIDHVIELGYIQPNEAREMMEYYLDSKLNNAQLQKLHELCRDYDITPATLEQKCLYIKDVDTILKELI